MLLDGYQFQTVREVILAVKPSSALLPCVESFLGLLGMIRTRRIIPLAMWRGKDEPFYTIAKQTWARARRRHCG